MSESHDYTLTVRWTSERKGMARAETLPPLEVATPPEFGGHPGIWSPEHLFVAALSSCLMATFLAIAANSKLEFRSFECPATGTVRRGEDRLFRVTEAVLRPRLVLAHAADRERAARILQKAEQACLISNSVRTTIRLEPVIEAAG
jgi:organic hydroperoxide reductase OsmC/OhrA